MIPLPSGTLVGITSIRARYHALRLNLAVDPETPHQELYGLVDIVVGPEDQQRLPGNTRFLFTGHTLAELPAIPSWSQDDREAFAVWLQRQTQIREIEQARKRIVCDEFPLIVQEYPYPQRLYSTLGQWIERISLHRASAQQWRQTLMNSRRQGIRDDEIAWSGILGFLDDQQQAGKKTISRDELLSHIDFATIRLCLTNELVSESAYQPAFSESPQCKGVEISGRHDPHHAGMPLEYAQSNRYEHKSLYGGYDYREWLLSLPDYPLSHFTSHYYERNLLLHFRTKQRQDHQGRRLLFIEELQSDWHQSGAMHGYQNRWPGRIPPAPFRKEWIGLGLKLILLHAAENGLDAIAWTQGDVHESHYLRPIGPVRRLYDVEIPRYLERLCHRWNPMIETTRIPTKEPRLHISRQMDKWFITDTKGSFFTPPRYSQQEAIRVMARHCRRIDLEVPALFLDKGVRERILEDGFPLFGEKALKHNDKRC
ncbi:MAG: hypothetical protein KZQ95_01630 [Candidatus Thiodiazotropha sp. (ex Epidulcina cf. delphinae)]|nr:hypothetical protein [Candidatus Thiodiazotropha sp. (ex Epidulcina cf. delphinae)]